MKLRTVLVGVAVLAIGAAALAVSAPTIAQYVAERQVDSSLARIRRLSTSVAHRGAVSIDLGAWTVTVKDIAIDPPGDGSSVRIGSLTIVKPWQVDESLTAERVIAKDVRMFSALGETRIPSFEARDYSGLARGLVATPGVGSAARSQADVISQISSGQAIAPSIEITDARTKVTRTFRDVAITAIRSGVVDRATLGSATVSAPNLRPGAADDAEGVTLTGTKLKVETLNLPTLWRFYAGDGAGEREELLRSLTVDELAIRAGSGPDGPWRASAKGAYVSGFRVKALAFPLPVLEDVVAKLDGEGPPTPTETRRRIALAVDVTRAFSFASIGARELAFEVRGVDGVVRSGGADAFAFDGYADARLKGFSGSGLRYKRGETGGLAFKSFELERFDASRITEYGARVGRDEVMLSANPTAEEIVRTAPRIGRVALSGGEAKTASGAMQVENAEFDLDAPLDNVPQKITARFKQMVVTAEPQTALGLLIDAAALDRLEGGGLVSLTFDPNTRALSVDALKAKLEGVGAVSAKGKFGEVDPLLAVSAGAAFVDKFMAIVLEPFRFTLVNDGGFETLIKRAAAKAGQPEDVFRTAFAQRTQEEFARLFGPPAAQSAAALAGFIRDPRAIVVSVDPKDAEVRLFDFMQSLDLGPAGVAQTIDVRVLTQR